MSQSRVLGAAAAEARILRDGPSGAAGRDDLWRHSSPGDHVGFSPQHCVGMTLSEKTLPS